MTSDGFSVNTTLSQIGNVARAQAKGQQTVQADPTAVHKTLQEEKRIDRVKKAEEALKKKIDQEQKRRRDPDRDDETRSDAKAMIANGDETTQDVADETATAREDKGRMLDTTA